MPTDQEMMAIEKVVCHSSPRGAGGACHATQGPPGEAPGWAKGRGSWEMCTDPLLWFLQDGMAASPTLFTAQPPAGSQMCSVHLPGSPTPSLSPRTPAQPSVPAQRCPQCQAPPSRHGFQIQGAPQWAPLARKGQSRVPSQAGVGPESLVPPMLPRCLTPRSHVL